MNDLWRHLFGNGNPVEVEIGPERGTFLLAVAAARPDHNFLGIERSPKRSERLDRSLRACELGNVRIVGGDAACIVEQLIPASSIAAYHIYFPDPWWKRRHLHRRLITTAVAAAIERTLMPDGRVHLLTDVEDLFAYARANLGRASGLVETGDFPRPLVRSAFQEKAEQRDARLYGLTLVKSRAPSPAVGIDAA